MDYTLLPICQLDSQRRRLLASLHRSVMETLLSDLGIPIVERYYQVAAEDENVIGFISIRDGKVLGWVVGSPYPQTLNDRLRAPLFWFAKQMLRLLFTHPRLLWQLAISARSAGDEFVLGAGEIELTYIGVAPEAGRQKLGLALLQEFVRASRAAGYRKISLSVETGNEAAINLYQRNGFQVTKTYTEGHYVRQRMELALESEL